MVSSSSVWQAYGIRDGDTKKHDQMLDRFVCAVSCAQLILKPREDQIVGLGIVDLMPRTLLLLVFTPSIASKLSYLNTSVNSHQGHTRTKASENIVRVFSDIGSGLFADNIRRVALHGGNEGVHKLVRISALRRLV